MHWVYQNISFFSLSVSIRSTSLSCPLDKCRCKKTRNRVICHHGNVIYWYWSDVQQGSMKGFNLLSFQWFSARSARCWLCWNGIWCGVGSEEWGREGEEETNLCLRWCSVRWDKERREGFVQTNQPLVTRPCFWKDVHALYRGFIHTNLKLSIKQTVF